ncbi:nucleoside triphosphate pyrophosphatase [Psychrobacter sp.]|uniref:Maf family protein n=1 Tax=Psychrobacter sp. TaxID=56811 RepID=UPI0025E05A56|nr:nucleoside triphosphate pyrophosphatase [Psychrobacter sp.]
MKIILASTSPRRQQLLTQADIEFEILTVEVDETVLFNESPQDYIVRMVKAKAVAAGKSLSAICKDNIKHCLVITADTIGVLPDERSILVKPTDKADAFDMWQKLSNTKHSVWTAVQLTVFNQQGEVVTIDNLLEKTEVSFIELDDEAMQTYWSSGEPADKAGGYAIQGKGAAWVKYIKGSYTNVVGLPLAQTLSAIKHMENKLESL